MLFQGASVPVALGVADDAAAGLETETVVVKGNGVSEAEASWLLHREAAAELFHDGKNVVYENDPDPEKSLLLPDPRVSAKPAVDDAAAPKIPGPVRSSVTRMAGRYGFGTGGLGDVTFGMMVDVVKSVWDLSEENCQIPNRSG